MLYNVVICISGDREVCTVKERKIEFQRGFEPGSKF